MILSSMKNDHIFQRLGVCTALMPLRRSMLRVINDVFSAADGGFCNPRGYRRRVWHREQCVLRPHLQMQPQKRGCCQESLMSLVFRSDLPFEIVRHVLLPRFGTKHMHPYHYHRMFLFYYLERNMRGVNCNNPVAWRSAWSPADLLNLSRLK